jgi:hypothetical protein
MFIVRLIEYEIVRVALKTLSVIILCSFYSDLVKDGIKLSHSTYDSTNQELKEDLRGKSRIIIISGVVHLAVVVVLYYLQFLMEIVFEFIFLLIISAIIHLRVATILFKKGSNVKHYSVLDGFGINFAFFSFLSVSLLFELIIIHSVWNIVLIISFGAYGFLIVHFFYYILISSRKTKSKWKKQI